MAHRYRIVQLLHLVLVVVVETVPTTVATVATVMLLLLVVDDREMRWLASFGRELAFESLFVVGRLGAECAETVAAAGLLGCTTLGASAILACRTGKALLAHTFVWALLVALLD